MKSKLINEVREYELTKNKDHKVVVRITSDHIEIEKPNGQCDFVFKSKRNQETIDRWIEVLSTLIEAVKFAGKQI
jgi:hypothetical protein